MKREYDLVPIGIIALIGIFLSALIGIPLYQHIVPKAVCLCDCRFTFVSGTGETVTDVWSIEKHGILDQEYVVLTICGERRFRASAVVTWDCISNGRHALIQRSCRRGGAFSPIEDKERDESSVIADDREGDTAR